MYVCTYVCTYVRAYIRTYIHTYACIYIYVYMYIPYACVHILSSHIHTSYLNIKLGFVFDFASGSKVCPSVDPVPQLLKGCVDSAAVDKDTLLYNCSFEADYMEFKDLTDNFWIINVPNENPLKVSDTSTHDGYSVQVSQDCNEKNETCCSVTTTIEFNTTKPMDNGTVGCYAKIPTSIYAANSSAHLSE